MPDFPAYTREELVERGRNLLRTRRRGIDLGVGSDYDLWARILGTLAWGEQKRAEGIYLSLDPRRAVGSYLEAYAGELAVGRDLPETTTEAVAAKGDVLLLAQPGSPALVQPAGSVLRHADGTEFTLDEDVTVPALTDKTFYSGHLSTRTRIYQGHLGAGFVDVRRGEVYLAMATGELCAVRGTNHESLELPDPIRHLVDLYGPLARDVALHDAFVRQPGTVASVTAKEPGTRGNKDSGDRLSLVAPVGTMRVDAYVLALSDGQDAMTKAEVQAAIAALLGLPRAPLGTLEDLRALGRAALGGQLADCYVTPGAAGLGTYTLLPIRPDGAYVNQADREAVLSYVEGRVSVADQIDVGIVVEVVDTRIDTLTVQVSTRYRPDWTLTDETLPGLAIESATTTTITLDATPPMAAGDRVIVTTRGPSGPYLVTRRVTDIDGLVLTLDAPLAFPPDPDDSFVTPGGALAEAIVDALYRAYGVLAPSVGTGRVRVPPPVGSDDPDTLVSVIARLEGVLDVAHRAGPAPSTSDLGTVLLPGCVVRMVA